MSSLLSGTFSHHFGRRAAIAVGCVLTIIGTAAQIATTNKGAVYFGRLVIGLGNGFLVTFSNIYTAEAPPAHLRALMVALFGEWVCIGSLVGAAITNSTQRRLDRASYQIPLGTQFIVPVVLLIGLCFVPESPRYLVQRGKLGEAREALVTLRGDSLSADEFELEWVEMVRGTEEEKKEGGRTGAVDMFRGMSLCWALSLT